MQGKLEHNKIFAISYSSILVRGRVFLLGFANSSSKTQPAKMSDLYMPDELFTKIFTYLPPKSLVRFTCVCKSWKSIITGSNFITDHLNQTQLSNNINNTQLFLVKYLVHNTEERYTLHIDNNRTFDQYGIIELPFPRSDSDNYLHVLGSCNGLICLSDEYGRRMQKKYVYLWNPSIRKSLTLPLPDDRGLEPRNLYHALGFGFDLRTNDYKVVRMTYLISDKGQSPIVQLYKLSTGSWETITATVDPSCSVLYTSSTRAFVNGAVHWCASKTDGGCLILAFNMSDEKFHEISLPVVSLPVSPAGHAPSRYDISVAVCGKRLSFSGYTTMGYVKTSCSIWVMKEYGVVESWTKLYTFDLTYEAFGRMLGFRRNGELLLENSQLVSFNPRTRLYKYLDVRCSGSFYLDGYVESLVLIGNDM